MGLICHGVFTFTMHDNKRQYGYQTQALDIHLSRKLSQKRESIVRLFFSAPTLRFSPMALLAKTKYKHDT